MAHSGNDLKAIEKIVETVDLEQVANTVDDRRALLKKLGRFGLYTAPALLLTFESAKAAIPSGSL